MKRKKSWILSVNPKLFLRVIIPGLIALAIIIWSAVAAAPGTTLDIFFLDIGQGDAIYGRLPTGEDFLIDGGPNNKVLNELGQIMPFWDHHINLLIASHNHADHIGGLDDVLERFDVDEIWVSGAKHDSQTYQKFEQLTKAEPGATIRIVKLGDSKNVGRGLFKILYPIDSQEGISPKDQHDATVVTKLSYGDIDFLFTGDLNETHEQEILNSSSSILNSEILKVPHHGSASGLLDNFLDAVQPRYAVIQVGAQNKFGHPTQSVLNKLSNRSIPTYRTDQNGRVEISTDSENVFVKNQK